MTADRPGFRRLFVAILLLSVAASFFWYAVALALLPKAAADRVNSPPVNVTCSKSSCHTPPPGMTDSGSVVVSGIPSCYEPGHAYKLTVTVSDSSAMRWGFELGVQYNENNEWDKFTAGTLTAGAASDTVASADGLRTFVTHQQNSGDIDGTYPGKTKSASWSVTWTAPVVRATPVCIYVAGVAANNNDRKTLDRTYNDKICIEPCGATRSQRETWGQLKLRYAR
jgi:hypothetical protein